MIKKYSFDELVAFAKDSVSQPDMMLKMGIIPRGRNYTLFRQNLISQNIDISHWKGRPKLKPPKIHTKESVLLELLVEDSTCSSDRLKSYLFRFDMIKNECSLCNQKPIWNNKKLVLQLDHINGNFRDNRLQNLRILCPNCHTQTDTFCRKRK